MPGKALEQDVERELDGAAAPQEVGREVEVDVVTDCELLGGGGVVARALELLGPPGFDALDLCLYLYAGLSRSHRFLPPCSRRCSVKRRTRISPYWVI